MINFCNRLYKDRLARIEEEERSLLSDTPTHPDYVGMMACLDERLKMKLAQCEREHEYRIAATMRIDEAQKAQIWSHFYQEIREARESTLESLNKQWYEVHTNRRQANIHKSPSRFSADATQRGRSLASYNNEVAILAAVARTEGFPAAPPMHGATVAEADSDLDAIRVCGLELLW